MMYGLNTCIHYSPRAGHWTKRKEEMLADLSKLTGRVRYMIQSQSHSGISEYHRVVNDHSVAVVVNRNGMRHNCFCE